MHFKSLPVTSLEDATVDFEQVQAFLSKGDIGVDSTGKLAVVSTVKGGKDPITAPSGTKVYQDNTVTGLTWPGATNTTAYTFAHGLATPVGAAYFVQHINSSGGSDAFCYVQNPTPTGCTVTSANPFGNPPAATGYGLYILAVLSY